MAKQMTKLFKLAWNEGETQKAGMRYFPTREGAAQWPVAGGSVVTVEVGQRKEELAEFLNNQLALNG